MYEDNNNDDTKQQIIRPKAYFMYEEILLSKFPFIKIDHVCYEKAYFFSLGCKIRHWKLKV